MGLSLLELPLPVRIVPSTVISDEELLAFARQNEPCRIEKNREGEIVVMTPVGNDGGRREMYLAREVDFWAEQDGRGEANGPNAGWNLPDGSTLSPDGSWTANERLQDFTAKQREHFLPLCPDFIAEIRSHSDAIAALQEKMELWMANGAQLGWLIDPFGHTVTIYRPGQQPETHQRPEVLEGEGPVAGFRLKMERFWA